MWDEAMVCCRGELRSTYGETTRLHTLPGVPAKPLGLLAEELPSQC
jgi:hypothetical protein